MSGNLPALDALIDKFRMLPGIGKKTAVRLAYSILDSSQQDAEAFAEAILCAKREIGHCRCCGNISQGELCAVCADPKRDHGTVCVVEDAKTVSAMERVREYRGVYHVLGGTLSPIDGRTPDVLNIDSLLKRVREEHPAEIILATNPTVDGETTALYLAKLLKPTGVRVTRLAYGIPVGGDLEYADEMTLFRAIDGRKEL